MDYCDLSKPQANELNVNHTYTNTKQLDHERGQRFRTEFLNKAIDEVIQRVVSDACEEAGKPVKYPAAPSIVGKQQLDSGICPKCCLGGGLMKFIDPETGLCDYWHCNQCGAGIEYPGMRTDETLRSNKPDEIKLPPENYIGKIKCDLCRSIFSSVCSNGLQNFVCQFCVQELSHGITEQMIRDKACVYECPTNWITDYDKEWGGAEPRDVPTNVAFRLGWRARDKLAWEESKLHIDGAD